jgi:HD-GYP domain-containing protein (c-di-GMP phosphodiesterase class II)
MLKRIHIQQLTLGMYLHELCGTWMEHPFWKARFLLKDANDLDRIRNTSIRECWIDTSKGLDVAEGTASRTPEEVDAQTATDFSRLDQALLVHPTVPLPPTPSAPVRDRAPRDMQAELKTAAAVCARTKQAVVSMFNEARMGLAVNTATAQGLVEEINDSVIRNPGALISLARLKTADDYTYMHSVAVCALMVGFARQLKLSDEQTKLAGMAGLMHDLGKAAVPLSVLNKPGKLTEAEFSVVRSHPVAGYHMLKAAAHVPEAVLDACLHHHEKIDGSGYPDQLKGDSISVIARMTAIADVYDAITSDRPYKRGWDPSESLRRMAEWTTTHFDARLFQAFVKSIGIYPVGSLVRLTSGRIGVVVERASQVLTMPTVKVFYSTNSNLRIPAVLVNLAADGCNEKIVAREDPDAWGFPDLHELWSGFAEKTW